MRFKVGNISQFCNDDAWSCLISTFRQNFCNNLSRAEGKEIVSGVTLLTSLTALTGLTCGMAVEWVSSNILQDRSG
jgi:hypothetical protein